MANFICNSFHNKITNVIVACTLLLIKLTYMISDSTIGFINKLDWQGEFKYSLYILPVLWIWDANVGPTFTHKKSLNSFDMACSWISYYSSRVSFELIWKALFLYTAKNIVDCFQSLTHTALTFFFFKLIHTFIFPHQPVQFVSKCH